MTDAVLPELAKTIASQGLLFAVLVAIIVTGIRATWVPGFAWQQMKAERDDAIKTLDRFVAVHEEQTRFMKDHAQQLKEVCEQLDRIEYGRGKEEIGRAKERRGREAARDGREEREG